MFIQKRWFSVAAVIYRMQKSIITSSICRHAVQVSGLQWWTDESQESLSDHGGLLLLSTSKLSFCCVLHNADTQTVTFWPNEPVELVSVRIGAVSERQNSDWLFGLVKKSMQRNKSESHQKKERSQD